MKKPSTNTDALEQRKIGIKLAQEHKAPKTAELIKNGESTHEDILRAAAQEVGVDKLAAILAKQHPEWSFHALRSIPDLGKHRDAFTKTAAEWLGTDKRRSGAPGPQAEATLQTVGSVELSLVWGSVMYACWFTMFWESAPHVIQPQASEYSPDKWVWSPKMDITYHPSFQYDCKHFELAHSKLSPGDPVWLHVQISGGGAHDVGIGGFKYEPGAPTLLVKAGGTTLNPSFEVSRTRNA
ncbi:MAG TPA: hypothetical protein VNH64_00985 [Parvularculaceae bacterium]|nr:hypothetical protein [Parvularculaceae bacterium]